MEAVCRDLKAEMPAAYWQRLRYKEPMIFKNNNNNNQDLKSLKRILFVNVFFQ